MRQEKIHFHLEQDEDGYPPFSVERVWATPVGNDQYLLDSIPFYVLEVSLGDKVLAPMDDGIPVFDSVIESSGHSTLRLVLMNDNFPMSEVTNVLEKLGCKWEGAEIGTMIAVDVPPEIEIEPVIQFLNGLVEAGQIDYQEACIRHS